MSPINDQETGYSSLSEATPLKIAEPKKSWRRVGVAAAIVSALALGAVAAIKTTSAKRGSQPTAFYPDVTVVNNVDYPVSGTVNYASCDHDSFTNLEPGSTWKASSRGVFGWCLVTSVNANVQEPDGTNVAATAYTSSGTGFSQWSVIEDKDGKYTVSRVVT